MRKTLEVNYTEFEHWNQMDASEHHLIEKAYAICDKAYAPYSNFFVGCIVQLEDGTEIAGNNQENIAYPSGICAERTALFYTGANHGDTPIKQMVIVAKGDLAKPDECLSPCGGCRQVMAESQMRQEQPFKVVLVSESGRTFIFDKGTDLLIFPFGI